MVAGHSGQIPRRLHPRSRDRGVGNFKIAIQRAAENNVFPSDLLSRADGLRKIRNPFSYRRLRVIRTVLVAVSWHELSAKKINDLGSNWEADPHSIPL